MSKPIHRLTFWRCLLLLPLFFPVGVNSNPAIATMERSGTPSVPMIYYLSPTGSDANSGGTPAEAWKTFPFAIPKLQPGDTLLLLDGTYQKASTGLPYINCASTGDAHNGSKTAPITIQAQNERMAFLQSDGSEYALLIKNCSFWNVNGLRGASADLTATQGGKLKSIFAINRSQDIMLKRLLSTHSNRYFNNHTYEIADSSGVLVEESEAYFFHRHGFSVYQSSRVTIRRSYANSQSYADLADGYKSINPTGGDESFVFYYTSDSVIENSVSYGNNLGFEIHGGPNFDGSPGGHNNQILGSIYLSQQDGKYGARIDTRKVDGVISPTANNLYKDFLVLNTGAPGVILSSTSGAKLENITVYNAGDDGIQVKETDANDPWCDDIPGGCSLTVTNSLVYQSAGYGIAIRPAANWLIAYSNVAGNQYGDFRSELQPSETISDDIGSIVYSSSITPTGVGLDGEQTIVYIPAHSNMKGKGKNGADIGATLLFRYQDTILTQQPLWDPATGAFPCGAIIPQVNDNTGSACSDLHKALNVTQQTLPVGYGLVADGQTLYLPLITHP